MSSTENILSGYCFLAALTENQNDLFNHVFVPICKRALSIYNLRGNTHGKVADIKTLITEEYGINVPLVMVKKLIQAAHRSLFQNKSKEYSFELFQDGESFKLKKFTFADLEIKYKKGERDARALQKAFDVYLETDEIDKSLVPPFADFLNKNKNHLAAFFNGASFVDEVLSEKSYIYHVQFLEQIESNNHDLFEIAKGLYIGSIVASFLEAGLDIQNTIESNEIYYLDTPIILRALDLQREEETEPIIEMLDLIRSTGGEIKVLSITIDEIRNVIQYAIDTYNQDNPFTTINEAAIRREKKRAWLIAYKANLEKNIVETLSIEKETIPQEFKTKYETSPDIKELQKGRFHKGSARHDVLSYFFVRDARINDESKDDKPKIWFLSSNAELLRFNNIHNDHNKMPEVILPDALTGLLWLKSPLKLQEKVSKIGLNELMASTLNDEIASKELINEYAENLKSLGDVSDDDYTILLEAVAHLSAKKIEHFNEMAQNDISKAKMEAQKIVELERSRRARRKKAVREAQGDKKTAEERSKVLSDRLSIIEQNYKRSQGQITAAKTEIEVLKKELEQSNQITKTITSYLLLSLAFIVAIIITIYLKSVLSPIISMIFQAVGGLGGVWSFCNFVINVINFKRNHNISDSK